MVFAVDVSCWQCSEYHSNFPHILNIIIELKKKKISANLDNILDRIKVGDEINNISEESLRKFFKCEQNYVSKYTYRYNVPCRVIANKLERECDICGNALAPFPPENINLASRSNLPATETEKSENLENGTSLYDEKINSLIEFKCV